MCGICGMVATRGQLNPASAERLDAMLASIVHRGPDEEGRHVDETVAMGMRRLSIIDLDGGSQPIYNEDESIGVVFNGEIYNFLELRKQLIADGHRFTTHTDTEVIVHLYEQYGDEFPNHLNGMFAIAVWDMRERRFLLVRDRLGVKPIYYAQSKDSLVFGSELKAVLASSKVTQELDPQAVYNYFTLGYIPQPRSIYKSVKKLPPASRLILEDGRTRIERYWSYPQDPEMLTDHAAACEQLRSLLDDATRIRMISDVPLGAFLSGGIDSSITVALMARHSSQPVKTFFIDFEESSYSEREYARAVAQRFGTDHYEQVVKADALGIVDQLTAHFDEPFGDSSAVPTWYLSQMTREHVTVALAGDGGDESFGGYRRYREILQRSEHRGARRIAGSLGRALHAVLPRTAPGRRYFRSLGLDNRAYFAVGAQEFEAREMLSADLLRQTNLSVLDDLEPEGAGSTLGADPLSPYAGFDVAWYLPDDILAKVDRMSMAHSLEVRGPFLDYRVVELAARMPSSWKISGTDTKVILKQAFQKELPESVLSPRKRGFSLPLDDWFRNELRAEIEGCISDSALGSAGLIQLSEFRSLAKEHFEGRRSRKSQLWRLLMFSRWWHGQQSARPTLASAGI